MAARGQPFGDAKYFWPRPSATSPYPNNASSSSGSNQGPLNPALTEAVEGRIKALREADPGNTAAVPVDLVTASASGLDPHISVAAASYQLNNFEKRVLANDIVNPGTLPVMTDADAADAAPVPTPLVAVTVKV